MLFNRVAQGRFSAIAASFNPTLQLSFAIARPLSFALEKSININRSLQWKIKMKHYQKVLKVGLGEH